MSNGRLDIYNYKGLLQKALKYLEEVRNILPENKGLIKRFHKYIIAEGRAGHARQLKIIRNLTLFAKWAKKPFTDFNKDDVVELVTKLENRGYSEHTKQDYRLMLKRFFKWMRGIETYPEEVKWIKNNYPKNTLMPNQLLTEEDTKKMVEVADHPRDKAFIFVLYESGCRIGEILTLQIKDVEFDQIGAFITVTGKTGPRRIRLIQSAPLLASWINLHPFNKNIEAPLWIRYTGNQYTSGLEFPIGVAGASKVVKRLAKKAGIKKRVHPHLFRHSRATHLAPHLSEALLKQHMGWTQSSNMAATYIHLSGQELDHALQKLAGIKVEEKKEKSSLNKITCVRCKNENSATSRFCSSCGFCFDIKLSMEIDETKEQINLLFENLVKNPEKLKVLLNLVQSET